MIISLSGVDCAGKTTQLDRLEVALTSRGHRVRRLWFRPGYSRLVDTLRSQVRSLRSGALPTSDQPKARAQVFARPGVRQAWITMAALDTLLNLGAHVRLLSWRGYTVLCDRYVEDAIVDLSMRFPDLVDAQGRLRRGLVGTCPRPDAAIMLTLSREVLATRALAKNEPFADLPEVRAERYDIYMRLAASGRFTVVDAERPIEDVTRAILDTLREA